MDIIKNDNQRQTYMAIIRFGKKHKEFLDIVWKGQLLMIHGHNARHDVKNLDVHNQQTPTKSYRLLICLVFDDDSCDTCIWKGIWYTGSSRNEFLNACSFYAVQTALLRTANN